MHVKNMFRINTIRLLLFLSLMVSGCLNVGAQRFLLRNSLLYDATLTPNIGAEWRTDTVWSVTMSAGLNAWDIDGDTNKKWRHLMLAPGLRRYNNGRHVSYWALDAMYSHFNVGNTRIPFGLYKAVKNRRLQGDLAGVALRYGRQWRLNSLLLLEAEAGLGAGYAWFKEYDCQHCGTYHGRDSRPFLLPQVNLNIVLSKEKKTEPVIIELPPVDTVKILPPAPPVLVWNKVADNTGRAGILEQDNPVLQHISQYRPYDRTRILRKDRGTLYVHFDMGKSILRADYRENGQTLQRIVDITRQVMADTTSSVKKIQIVGLASIEGAITANELLANNRAMALQHYLQQQLNIDDSLFDTVGGGEAWAELRDQLLDIIDEQSDGTPDTMDNWTGQSLKAQLRQAVIAIDTESDPNRLEQQLRRMNGGRTWQYLKNNVLKDQRNSGYIRIYYDYVPDKAAATINRASELLQEKQYAEALQLLLTVKTDERAQNALGVALYNNGRMAEAMECFEKAANNGNNDARHNLKELVRQLER